MAKPYRFSNQRVKDLGLEFTPLKKSLYEAVVCMQKKGHLPVMRDVRTCKILGRWDFADELNRENEAKV
jgi:hypothetical protein